MAARRAKTDRSVLSRQAIATRRQALTDQKLKTGGAGRRAIIGVAVLAASVLALLSVATFTPKDRVGPGFHNAIGPVGHAIAEGLRGLLGLCAYVLPLSGLYLAGSIFVGEPVRRRWPQLVCLALLSISGAVLAQLLFAGTAGWSHPPGGVIGQGLSGMLTGLFSVVGTVVLVSAICAAALIVGTQFAFLKLCTVAWSWIKVAGHHAEIWAMAFFAAQKEAFAVRRAESAKAREEEAAFLAQLEEDEEQLNEAEREAAEADAMAEEAFRLSREAEEAAARKKEAAAAKRSPPPQVLLPPPPSNPRPAAGADPAWVSALLPQKPLVPAGEPANLEGARDGKKRERKVPQIVASPATPVSAIAPAASLESEAASTAPPPSQALALAPPSTLAARMPLIVEPKAPPQPTKKKDQEQFHFVGDRKSFNVPPIDVLESPPRQRSALDKEAFLSTAEKLRAKLADFGIDGEVVEIRPGPVVTMYEFLPGPGIKVSKIASLADDLAMAMEAMRVRIVAPIPGKGVVGIEVPNRDRETVYLKEIAEQDAFTKSASRLTMCVGKDIEGMPYVFDLAKAPHLLIAGTTGSGKSVAVNSMIMSILLKSTPEEVRFIMVDPKMLELSVYEGIPHLLLPVVTDPKKAALALRWAVEEMERRYHLLSEAGVRNITGFNKYVETLQEEGRKTPPKKAPAATAGRKMLIVDVGEGETEEEALERKRAVPAMGVASPNAENEEPREAVGQPVDPELAAAEIRVDPDALSDEESAALSAAAAELTAPAIKAAEEKQKELQKLPYIVVIIDELADLMMVASREVETYIARLAKMARAAGIHLMVATQRPSTDVITGVIKANFPTRISFMLRSKPDSMTILGTVGAEALLGMGDMLIQPPTSTHLQRVHGAYVSEEEIKRAVDHLKAQGKPVYDESILKVREEDSEGAGEEDELSDELYDQALATVSEMRSVSISMLQRKMRIGYNRAARMIERMERDGVVSAADGAKPREVLLRPVGEMPGAGAM